MTHLVAYARRNAIALLALFVLRSRALMCADRKIKKSARTRGPLPRRG